MLPIRIRQLPQFLRQTLERELALRRRLLRPATFHLCFFSCRSYFPYLYCSLHSLATHLADVSFKVLVFSDQEQPLSEPQIAAIQTLIPAARVMIWPKSMGWGAKQIASIWEAYALAARDVHDDDFVARVDSDVFFFNDRIFQVVQRVRADLVGDGHYVGFRYCQGGCYFFRASAVRRIANHIETVGVERALEGVDTVVEDVAATHFARQLGFKVWQTWFMMFPDELRNACGLRHWQRWKFSCAHFVMKNKTAMLDAYTRYVLTDPSPTYAQILETP